MTTPPPTPREALEKAECVYRPEFAEMVTPNVAEIDAILTALAPFLRTPGAREVCGMLNCEKPEYQWQDCEAANCPIRKATP